MATPAQVRQVAIEVAENIETIKAAVDALKTNVDAIQAVTTLWTLDGIDADLPTEAAVAAQTVAYEALSVSVSKPSNSIADAITAVKAAAV